MSDERKTKKSPAKLSKPSSSSKTVKGEQPEDKTKSSKPGPADAPDAVSPEDQVRQGEGGLHESWPLEADRVAMNSPLVECLRLVAGHYGRRTSVSSLTAGLPIPKSGMTPTLFIRAAERAGLDARMTEQSLAALEISATLPCILVLKHGQACILRRVGMGHRADQAEGEKSVYFSVRFPEAPDEQKYLSREELAQLYSGYAFFVRPEARLDERAGPAVIDTARDWFWGALKEHKRLYQEVALAAVMINLFALVNSLFVMNVYDRVVPNSAFDTLWVLAAGVLIAFAFDFMLKELRARFLDHAGRKADVKISARLFAQMMGMKMGVRPASAGVLASNMREFEGLRDFFTSATVAALVDLPFVFLFIAIIALIGGPIAFVPLAAIPLVLVVGWLLQGTLQKIMAQSMLESALKNARLFETITGLETIKVHAAEGHTQHRWEELTDKASRTAVKSRKLASFAINWAVLVQQITSVAIVIVGVYMISEGMLSMGGLIACVILGGRALAPLAQVAGLMTRFNQSREALRQLDDLMKKEVERPAGKHFIAKADVKGKVDFQDVTFHYPGQSMPTLNRINLTIKAGERVGIIGAVGSGKTTLERLLLNLYQPDSGSVQLDGSDVRQIDPGDLRRAVGVVQQSPQLFYGSVRENITLGHETAPEAAILKAAEMAGVLEWLRDSQAGLDTQVGERGEALSGGQRQAVAIARALLYDPQVLILDEPTASLDPASERRLLTRMKSLCEGKTTILITHKGPMLSLVDKIILLDRGRMLDYGPKDQIIAKLQARQYGSQAEQTEI